MTVVAERMIRAWAPAHGLQQLGRGQPLADVDLVAGRPQAVQPAVGDLFRDQDPRHRRPCLPLPTAQRHPIERNCRSDAIRVSVRRVPTRTETSDARMDRDRYGPGVDGGLDDIERWFVARGLPHFVERRDSAWEIWGRAAPLLAVAYLLLGLYALDLSEWSLTENVVAALAVVGAAVLTWAIANAMRRRPWFDRPHEIGPVELAVFILVPAVASLVVGQPLRRPQDGRHRRRHPRRALGADELRRPGAARLGVAAHVVAAARRCSNVLARALPMLLLFSAFLFINAEAWQVAGTLTGIVYVAVLGIFFLLGATFVLIRIPALMRSLNQFDSWHEVAELAASTPGRRRARRPPRADRRRPARRTPDDPPARQHRPADDLLAGDPDHAGRARPHRVLRAVRLPRHPRGDGALVDPAHRVDVLVPLARRRPRAGDHRAAARASPASSAPSVRCTSPCCCRPTRCTARSSPTTSARSCAKLSPCAACTGPPAGRRRRERVGSRAGRARPRDPPARRPRRATAGPRPLRPGLGDDDAGGRHGADPRHRPRRRLRRRGVRRRRGRRRLARLPRPPPRSTVACTAT